MILKKLIICLFIFVLTEQAGAQKKVEVTVSEKEMSKGVQTGFIVYIPEAKVKLVENEWKKFINERSLFEFATKGTSQTVEKAFVGISNIFSKEKKVFNKNSLKVERIGDEFVVKNVIHEEVTNNHIDVFARVTKAESGVFLSSFYQHSDSVFINESNVSADAIESLKSYIREFGIETYQIVVEEQVSDAMKLLRREERELKDLENKNKLLHNSIGKFETEIEESENSIRLVENELYRIETRLAESKEKLRGFKKKTVEYGNQKEDIKLIEKEYKKEYKKIKAQKNKIVRNKTRIKRAKADILINEKEQLLQSEVIRKKQEVVRILENKLVNIK